MLRERVCFNRLRIPGDSTWKHPSVAPRASVAAVAGSSSGIAPRSTSSPSFASFCRQSSSTVSARLPSRSIFTSPMASTPSLSSCVTTTPLAERWQAIQFVIGPGDTTTPPGCSPKCRGVSSRFPAVRTALSKRGSSKGKSRHSGVAASARAMGFAPSLAELDSSTASPSSSPAVPSKACPALGPTCQGSFFDQRETSAGGMPCTSAASRKADRSPKQFRVEIIAVRSGPKSR